MMNLRIFCARADSGRQSSLETRLVVKGFIGATVAAWLFLSSTLPGTAASAQDQAPSSPALASSSTPGPLAWWDFHEGAGTVVHDITGNGFNGVLQGAAKWVDGPSGKALSFDGSSFVEMAFNQRLLLGGPFSIQALIYPTDYRPSTYKNIVELWDSYLLRLDNPPEGGKLSFFTFLDGNPEPRIQAGIPELAKWHQVVAVWDGAKMQLWLDGVKAENARTGQPAPKSNKLHVGQSFIGAIDEVKIYNRALTEDEIWDLFPPKLKLTLRVPQPVFEIGKTFTVTCEIANAGGQPLPGGTVQLTPPAGLALVTGELVTNLPTISRTSPRTLSWKLQANAALAAEIKVTANLAGIEPATKSAKVVVAKPIPMEGATYDQPVFTRLGDNSLILANQHLRLVFPSNDFGYGVFAVDVNQSNRWTRMAVANELSYLVVKNGSDQSRHFIFAQEYQSTNSPGSACGLEFRRSLDDGAGTGWDCRFSFTISNDDRVKITYEATPNQDGRLVLFQGPTFYVGEGAFGSKKDDGLFGGLEWLVGQEASSSNLDMHDPDYYLRYVPHPNKITVPLMAFSQNKVALALYWDCLQQWNGTNDRPAAVYASPNFLEGQENNLMGLFLPSVPGWVKPNTLEATDNPYPFSAQAPLRLEAWVTGVTPAQQSIACVPRWFDTFGVPDPAPLPRGNYVKEIEFSARAFLESLWVPAEQQWWTSKGAGDLLSPKGRPPHFAYQLRQTALMTQDANLQQQCLERAALAERLGGFSPQWDDLGFTWANPAASLSGLSSTAINNLNAMGDDGSWRFHTRIETNGVFKGMDYSLLGPDKAAEVGTCARNAYEVLRFARIAGDAEVFKAAEQSLTFMEQFTVPRAAQVWECPVHSPDILAAADAVEAYLEAYRYSGQDHYLREAIRWAWTGIPFVYLWNPPGKPILRYASIAIYGGSWYAGSWIGQPVQWNGLRYAYALLKLADYDSSFPWRRIAEGLTISALYQQDTSGTNVALWPDNFSALDWSKASWVFEPGMIMKNVYKMLDRDIEPGTLTIDAGSGKLRLSSRAKLTNVSWQNGVLKLQALFQMGESGAVVVTSIDRPAVVLLNGATLPIVQTNFGPGSTNGWQYLSGSGFLLIRLSSSGPNVLEISGAKYRTVTVFPKLASAIFFDFDLDLEGWMAVNQVENLRVEDGLMKGTATGSDPYLHRVRLQVDGTRHPIIRVRSRAAFGSNIALYWITEDSPSWAEDKAIHLPLKPGNAFNEYVFEVGKHPRWAGKTIIGIRLDPLEGGNGSEFAVDYLHDQSPKLVNLGFGGDAYKLSLEGDANTTYRVEASTNLIEWSPLWQQRPTNGLWEIHDPNAVSFSQRFYRAAIAF